VPLSPSKITGRRKGRIDERQRSRESRGKAETQRETRDRKESLMLSLVVRKGGGQTLEKVMIIIPGCHF
jgi:hypothetical protein